MSTTITKPHWIQWGFVGGRQVTSIGNQDHGSAFVPVFLLGLAVDFTSRHN